jgi:transcriptional regulator with XRE-family HTH domain
MNAVNHRAVSLAFGAVLRVIRDSAQVSQERLAELADLDRTMPSRYERGLQQPTIANLIAIGRALECEPCRLLQMTIAKLHEPPS